MRMFANTNTEITVAEMRKDYADSKKVSKRITDAGVSVESDSDIVYGD